jgi:hypothetical protein
VLVQWHKLVASPTRLDGHRSPLQEVRVGSLVQLGSTPSADGRRLAIGNCVLADGGRIQEFREQDDGRALHQRNAGGGGGNLSIFGICQLFFSSNSLVGHVNAVEVLVDDDAAAPVRETANAERAAANDNGDRVVLAVHEISSGCHDPARVDEGAAGKVEAGCEESQRDLVWNLAWEGVLTADNSARV